MSRMHTQLVTKEGRGYKLMDKSAAEKILNYNKWTLKINSIS